MDLEDDTHMTNTTTNQEVINLPIMISPDMYNQLADLIIKKLENRPSFDNLIEAMISDWMDRNFDINVYDLSSIKDDITNDVLYEIKSNIRAEVEIHID
jgi:hypothetical protein